MLGNFGGGVAFWGCAARGGESLQSKGQFASRVGVDVAASVGGAPWERAMMGDWYLLMSYLGGRTPVCGVA